jgi:hypothetical protein
MVALNVYMPQGLTPVILATWEAEIPGGWRFETNSSRPPISKIPNTKKGWWSGSSGSKALSSNLTTTKKCLYAWYKTTK